MKLPTPLPTGRQAHGGATEHVPAIVGDRRFSDDIKKIDLMIKSGELLDGVKKIVGKLG